MKTISGPCFLLIINKKKNVTQSHILLFFLYSNHDRPEDNHVRRFLERHGIPYHYLPTTSGNKREQEILELIEGTDFVVLARYMQVNLSFFTVFFFPPYLILRMAKILTTNEC